jgi:hypothetical protein
MAAMRNDMLPAWRADGQKRLHSQKSRFGPCVVIVLPGRFLTGKRSRAFIS